MGCSPSHALIINSNTRPHDPICLQPRIYMVSESTLRILEDVGELRLYQQEDKDPGIARVRFGTNTLDQLENPVGFQAQIKRQPSLDSEQSLAIARQDSKITVNLTTTEEEECDETALADDAVDDANDKNNSASSLTRENSTASSTTFLINAQVHNPSPLKTLAKERVENYETCKNLDNDDDDDRYRLESVNSSCASL